MKALRILLLSVALIAAMVGLRWWFQPVAQAVEAPFEPTASSSEPLSLSAGGLKPASLTEANELFDQEELLAARERLEAALPTGQDEGALNVLLSVVSRRLHDREAALAYGRRGAELLPTLAAAHHVYSRAIAEEMRLGGMVSAMKNMKPWLEEIRTVIRLDPSNIQARVEEFFFLGFVPKLMGGSPELARQRLSELEALDKPQAIGLRSLLLGHEGRESEARDLLQAGVSEFPEDGGLRLVHGTLLENLARGQELPEDGETLRSLAALEFMRAMELSGGTEEEVYFRAAFQGASVRIEGEFDLEGAHKLLDLYQERMPKGELMPTESMLYLRRGQALRAQERYDEAKVALERSLELNPDSAETRRVLSSLPGAPTTLGG